MRRRKETNKKMLVSVFIIAIMVLSVFGFMLSYQTNQTEKIESYNGYTFARTNKGFMTKIEGKEFYFDYYPADLETINQTGELLQTLADKKALAITYNPNSELAVRMAEIQFDIEQKTQKKGDIYVTRALTNSTGYALPEITCQNATQAMPVIRLKQGKTTHIQSENNCITLNAGTETELNALYTKTLYTILGVMK